MNDLPTDKQVKELIQLAKQSEWPIYNAGDDAKEYNEKIKKVYFSIFKTLPSTFRIIDSLTYEIPLYRVREWDQINNINFFSEHSYPPAAFTKLGRCNFPNFPVFYSSDNPMISLMEVIRENDFKNKFFCISKWKIKGEASSKIKLQHFLNHDLPKANYFKNISSKDDEKVNLIFGKKISAKQLKGFKELLKFLNSEFTNDKDYNISASLSHNLFFGSPKMAIDVLIYPSMQSKYKGVNFALHPNFADNMLKLKRLYKIKVNEFTPNNNIANIDFIGYADIENNKPIWKRFPENEFDRLEILKEDFNGIGKT